MPSAGSVRGPFRVLESRSLYTNPWLSLREDHVIRPDGNPGLFGVVEMREGSTVLALDRIGQAFLVKEYKYAVDRESIELMSGGFESGETPLEAAKRELKEETGLIAKQWVNLGVVDPFTTVVRSPNHMFLALDVSSTTRHPDPGEDLTIVKLPFKQVLEMVMQGEITHAASCVLILKASHYLAQQA